MSGEQNLPPWKSSEVIASATQQSTVIRGIATSPNGRYVCSGDDQNYVVYDLNDKLKKVSDLKKVKVGGRHLQPITFSRDGSFLAVVVPDTSGVYGNKNGAELHLYETNNFSLHSKIPVGLSSAESIEFNYNNPNQILFATKNSPSAPHGNDGCAVIFDLVERSIVTEFDHSSFGCVQCATYDPNDDNIIATGSFGSPKPTLHLWNVNDPKNKKKQISTKHSNYIWQLRFAKQSTMLISICSNEHVVRIHSVDSGTEVQICDLGNLQPIDFTLAGEGNILVVGCREMSHSIKLRFFTLENNSNNNNKKATELIDEIPKSDREAITVGNKNMQGSMVRLSLNMNDPHKLCIAADIHVVYKKFGWFFSAWESRKIVLMSRNIGKTDSPFYNAFQVYRIMVITAQYVSPFVAFRSYGESKQQKKELSDGCCDEIQQQQQSQQQQQNHLQKEESDSCLLC